MRDNLVFVNWDTLAYDNEAADEMVADILKGKKGKYLGAFQVEGYVWVAPVDQEKYKKLGGFERNIIASVASWQWSLAKLRPGKFHLSLFEDCRHHLWCRRVFASSERAYKFAIGFTTQIRSYDWLFEYGDEPSIAAFDRFCIYVEDEWIVYREWLGDFTVTLNDPLGGDPIVQPVIKDEIFLKDEAVKEACALIDEIEFNRHVNPNQLSLF